MRKVVSKYVSILIIFLLFTAIVILACGCDKKDNEGNDSDSAIEADYKSEADTSEKPIDINETTPETTEEDTMSVDTGDNNTDVVTTPEYVPLVALATKTDLSRQRPIEHD